MADTKSLAQARATRVQSTERGRQLDWQEIADYENRGTRWEAGGKTGWYKSLRPVLDRFAGHYFGKSLKFSDYSHAEMNPFVMDASYVWLRADGVRVLKTEYPIPIEIDPTIGKTDKRISRLFRTASLYGWYNESDLDIKTINVGPASRLALEGAEVSLSWNFVWDIYRQASEEARRIRDDETATAEDRAMAHEECRTLRRMLESEPDGQLNVDITIQTRGGQIKGNAIVREQRPDIVVLSGAEKPEVRWDEEHGDLLYIAIKPAKGSDLVLDVQNVAMHGHTGFFGGPDGWLIAGVRRWLQEKLRSLSDGSYETNLARLVERTLTKSAFEKVREWFLLNSVASGFDIRWTSKTLGLAAAQMVNEIASDYGRRGFPVPGAKRLYLMTDYRRGTRVPRGMYEVVGETIVVNAVDYVTADKSFQNLHELNAWIRAGGDVDSLSPGIAATLGGCDQDDLIVVLDNVITRSPTQVGEYWIFDGMPGHDTSLLPPRPAPEYWWSPEHLHIEGRSKGALLMAARKMRDGAGAIGMHAKGVRYYVTVYGELPSDIPCSMETVIDSVNKDFADMTEVVNYWHEKVKNIAREGIVPVEMAHELARSSGIDVAEMNLAAPGQHWFDQLVSSFANEVECFESAVQTLRANAMPPQRMLEEYETAEPTARRLRQLWGNIWKDAPDTNATRLAHDESVDDAIAERLASLVVEEWWESVNSTIAEFLGQFDERTRVEIMGATLALMYKDSDGSEPVRDALCFISASRDYTLEAFRQCGLCGTPIFDDGLQVEFRESHEAPRLHLKTFNAWAHTLGIDPGKVTKAERSSLVDLFDPNWFVGKHLGVMGVEVMTRGKLAPRFALTYEGRVVATLPASVAELPEKMEVLWAFKFDGATHLICQVE